MEIQLPKNVLDMRPKGCSADSQENRDILSGKPFREALEDLASRLVNARFAPFVPAGVRLSIDAM
jgi:hypothetical protein